MTKFRDISTLPTVGTIVTSRGFPEQKWHRPVMHTFYCGDKDWVVLGPNNSDHGPALVEMNELRRNWVEVLPEPKVRRVRAWVNPDTGSISSYKSGDDWVRVEFDATEVQR